MSEPLVPRHGLEPGIDLLEAETPRALMLALERLQPILPAPTRTSRRRGRRKAETFRASRVWPRLLGDLRADVAGVRAPGRGGRAGPLAPAPQPAQPADQAARAAAARRRGRRRVRAPCRLRRGLGRSARSTRTRTARPDRSPDGRA